MTDYPELAEKKVVVTGAAGFIGSHLTEMLLENNAHVTALVHYNSNSQIGWLKEIRQHPNLNIVAGDVRDPFQMSKLLANAEIVFHLAALIGIPYSYKAPQSYLETNIQGTLNLLEAAKLNGVGKLIVTSTSEVYGTAITVPIDEKHPLQAQSPYSATKIAADMLAKSYAASFNLPVTIVRPFNTFGPRQSLRAVIPAIILQAMRGNVISLGDLAPVRDFNYVTDTASGFIAAAIHGRNDASIYNLATGIAHSIGDTAALIGQIMGLTLEIRHENERTRPPDSEVMKLLGDSQKAAAEIKWIPEHSFKQGLEKTINWLKSNAHTYDDPQKFKS